MDPATDPSAKRLALQHSGTFNPRAERVRHSMFQASEFFDPGDLLQLKYEALRALKHDGYSIARAAQEFGLSRPTRSIRRNASSRPADSKHFSPANAGRRGRTS